MFCTRSDAVVWCRFSTPFVKISMAWWGLVVQTDRSLSVSFFIFMMRQPGAYTLTVTRHFEKIMCHWRGRANNLKLWVGDSWWFIHLHLTWLPAEKESMSNRWLMSYTSHSPHPTAWTKSTCSTVHRSVVIHTSSLCNATICIAWYKS